MEVEPALLLTLKEHPVQVFEKGSLKWMGARKNPGFQEMVNRMGKLSSKARGLSKCLTTYDRLVDSEQTLYINWEPANEENNKNLVIIGFAKVARSQLYLRNTDEHSFITQPLCLMDFYIHDSLQRQDYGRKLFDFVLQKEGVEPHECAFDNPTPALVSFLQKKYNLVNPIRQSNRFVVYERFFETLEPELDGANFFSAPCSRLSSQRSSITSPLTSARNDNMNELIHQKFAPREERRAYEADTPQGRKYTRDFTHQSIW